MADIDDLKIRIMPAGPYIITGELQLVRRRQVETPHGEPVEWEPSGEDIEVSGQFALCRCGRSSNKPFCDGAHAAVDFDGQLTAPFGPGEPKVFEGDGVVMTDDPTLCADAGYCGTRFTNVWTMIGQTDDPEVREKLKRMVAFCPSGRLALRPAAGGNPIEPEYRPSIAVTPNGPLWVRGGIPIETRSGESYAVRNRVTLCRCGQSQNKPFCDGAHKSHGFEAE